jgi:hypothetical protein
MEGFGFLLAERDRPLFGLPEVSRNPLAILSMVASQCGNDRPVFGLLSVPLKLRVYDIIRVLNIINLKLYNII